MSNLPLIKQMYDALKTGDSLRLIGHLREDIDWQYGANSTNVPWLTARRGHQGVIDFFGDLALVEMRVQPKAVLESGLLVVVVIDAELIVKANGQRIHEEDAAHIWTFDNDGRVSRFRSRVDTAAHAKAFNYKP